ncbi:hypothetical protein [Bremerella cremea]|uniref:hypothetical protein n=1 Tax=Bremerella cremea TaxID=1031537 RepID=UPI0031EEEAAE
MKVRHIFLTSMAWFGATWGVCLHAEDELFRPIYLAEERIEAPESFERMASFNVESAQPMYAPAPVTSYCQEGWRLGVEATFLAPMGGNQQTWSLVNEQTSTVNSFATDAHGIEGLVPAPRFWVGYVCGNGWGVQARYWELNTSSNYSEPFFTLGEDYGYSSSTNLEMYAFDLEVVKEFCIYDWNMVGTFGYRHALRDYNETTNTLASINRGGGGTDLFAGTASGISLFEGDGLTFSLSGYRCSSCCYGLQWFWNARGSVLFGDSRVGAQTSSVLNSPGGDVFQTNGGFAGDSDSLWIAEFQVGAQWSAQLKCLPGRFFVRGAFEYQYWGEVGAGAGATSTAGEAGVGSLTMNSLAPNDSLDLVGFAISTGIVW